MYSIVYILMDPRKYPPITPHPPIDRNPWSGGVVYLWAGSGISEPGHGEPGAVHSQPVNQYPLTQPGPSGKAAAVLCGITRYYAVGRGITR